MVIIYDYRYEYSESIRWYFTGGSTPTYSETKEEKQARIAKEKMYNSWNTYVNIKAYISVTLIKPKQFHEVKY